MKTVNGSGAAVRAARAAAALCLAAFGLSACTDWALYDVDKAIGHVPQLSTMRVSVIPDPYGMPRGAPDHSIPTQSPLGNVPAKFSQDSLAAVAARMHNPLPASAAMLAHGKVKFDTNCAVCHGPAGKGNGSVVGAGKFPFAPALAPGSAAAQADGYIYAVLTAGRNFMPPYGERLTETDRWAIVAYVRHLQGGSVLAPGAAPAPAAPAPTAAPAPAAAAGSTTRPTTTP